MESTFLVAYAVNARLRLKRDNDKLQTLDSYFALRLRSQSLAPLRVTHCGSAPSG